MPENLIDLGPEQLQSGVWPDLKQRAAPLFVDASNVLFADGGIQPVPGASQLMKSQASQPIRGAISIVDSTSITAFAGDDDAIYAQVVGGAVSTVGSGYSTTDHWSFQRWGSWLLATNGVDTPQIYKGSSFANLTGLGSEFTTLKFFARVSPFLLGFYSSAGSDYYHWSDEDDAEDWVVTTANQAGNAQIRDLDSEIQAVTELNDNSVAVFTLNQMHTVSYVGTPFLFGNELLVSGVGTVGPKGVVRVGQLVYGFGPQFIWVTDGVSRRILSDSAVSDYIYSDLNRDNQHRVVAQWLPSEQAVAFYYPGAGATYPNKGVIYCLPTQTWSILSYGRTASDQAENQQYMITGDQYGRLWSQNNRAIPFEANEGIFSVKEAATVSATYGSFNYGSGLYGGTMEFT